MNPAACVSIHAAESYRDSSMRYAVLIIALAVALSAGEPPPVTLRVRPHVMFPGQGIWIEARVQPHPENRWLELSAEPELAKSEASLEGLKAPKRFERRWVAGEPGEYLIHVRVLDGRRQLRAYAQQRIVVSD
jgi:hypothetical protein